MTRTTFSEVDKKILKSLVASKCRVSSLTLSRTLEVPLTTIQRRRKRLEAEYLVTNHFIRLQALGWRHGQLLVCTGNGMVTKVGRDLLTLCPEVLSVNRSIGEHTIDLLVEVVFKENKELAALIDRIKAMEGVKDVIWTENIETLGRNDAALIPIIEQL
jgi:DNA-binding Lrp family transcriptional regulator